MEIRLNKFMTLMAALAAVVVLTMTQCLAAFGMETGTYLVTVTPSYTNPVTGGVDDPGNNEAIGQGMTERMCGSTGLLEVDSSGQMYLTVRYYLSQFIRNVTFEEGNGKSYSSVSYQEMQKKAAQDGAADISDKYGYTDYRIPISSIDSVFRGKAYIDAMGRDVVYFFTISSPVPGSGDFVTGGVAQGKSAQAGQSAEELSQTVVIAGQTTGQTSEQTTGQSADTEEADRAWVLAEEDELNDLQQEDAENGSGEANDPVTGIPIKAEADAAAAVVTKEGPLTETVSYHLDTNYDLSTVPLDEARKAIEPILDEAVGITNSNEKIQKSMASVSAPAAERNPNQTIMVVLVTAAVVLLVQFMAAGIKHKVNNRRLKS